MSTELKELFLAFRGLSDEEGEDEGVQLPEEDGGVEDDPEDDFEEEGLIE